MVNSEHEAALPKHTATLYERYVIFYPMANSFMVPALSLHPRNNYTMIDVGQMLEDKFHISNLPLAHARNPDHSILS